MRCPHWLRPPPIAASLVIVTLKGMWKWTRTDWKTALVGWFPTGFTDLRDAVVHVAVHDLNGPHARLVRRCQEEPCHRIFFASRRFQIYCSHRCANMHSSRRYRAANRRKRAERERERYRQRVITRIGGGAIRVGRRQRSKESEG